MINKVLFKVSQSLLGLSVQTWLSLWEQPESEQLPDNWQITNMQDQIFLHVHNTCSSSPGSSLSGHAYWQIVVDLCCLCVFPTCSLSIQTRTGPWPRINATPHTRGELPQSLNYTRMTLFQRITAKRLRFKLQNRAHRSCQSPVEKDIWAFNLVFVAIPLPLSWWMTWSPQ